MTKRSEAVGKSFNRWFVVSEVEFPLCLCRCACGTERNVNVYNVIQGSSKSCGCHKHDELISRNKTHGESRSRTYVSWCSMWTRCTNRNTRSYETYKHREPPMRWKSFTNFLEDMGECPEGMSLERVDNNLPYSKENCKWIPTSHQSRNRSTTTLLYYKEEVWTLKQVCKDLEISYPTVIYRVKRRGMTFSDALGVDVALVKKGSGYA